MQGRADCQTLVAGGGLNPRAPERCARKQLPVRHAVQRTAACHRQVGQRHTLMQSVEQMEERLLETMLHAVGEVAIPLRDLGTRLSARAERFLHSLCEVPRQPDCALGSDLHALIAPEWLEVAQVELKAIRRHPDDARELLAICRSPVRGESHHFAFIAVAAITDELADHGIEGAQRMRNTHAVQHLDVVPSHRAIMVDTKSPDPS